MYIPSSTSFPYVPEEGESNSGSDWRSLMLEPYVTLRGKLMPAASWKRVLKKGGWIKHLFGRIFDPLMAERGMDSWIASVAATRANPSPSADSKKGKTTQGTSGPKSSGSSKSATPQWSSSRTSQTTLTSDSIKSSETFKAWTSTLRQDYSRRRKCTPLISESVCSSWGQGKGTISFKDLWPTPVANDDNKTPAAHMKMKKNMPGGARKKPTSLQVAAKMWSKAWNIWPTPNVPNGGRLMSLDLILNKGKTETGSTT